VGGRQLTALDLGEKLKAGAGVEGAGVEGGAVGAGEGAGASASFCTKRMRAETLICHI